MRGVLKPIPLLRVRCTGSTPLKLKYIQAPAWMPEAKGGVTFVGYIMSRDKWSRSEALVITNLGYHTQFSENPCLGPVAIAHNRISKKHKFGKKNRI